jgi:hypothetical protein
MESFRDSGWNHGLPPVLIGISLPRKLCLISLFERLSDDFREAFYCLQDGGGLGVPAVEFLDGIVDAGIEPGAFGGLSFFDELAEAGVDLVALIGIQRRPFGGEAMGLLSQSPVAEEGRIELGLGPVAIGLHAGLGDGVQVIIDLNREAFVEFSHGVPIVNAGE